MLGSVTVPRRPATGGEGEGREGFLTLPPPQWPWHLLTGSRQWPHPLPSGPISGFGSVWVGKGGWGAPSCPSLLFTSPTLKTHQIPIAQGGLLQNFKKKCHSTLSFGLKKKKKSPWTYSKPAMFNCVELRLSHSRTLI